MNYVGRKDGGKYIPSKQEASTTTYNKDLLRPIAYNAEVAKFAAEKGIKYREAFLFALDQEK